MAKYRKYVFLTLKSEETEFLYSGFNNLDNGCLISLDRGKLINRYTRSLVKDYSEKGNHKFLVNALVKNNVVDAVCRKLTAWGNEEIVFLVYARVYESYGRVLTDEIRKSFPKAIICVYYADLQKRFTIESKSYKRDFDCLFSFDQKEAEKYGLNYLLEPFTYHYMNENSVQPIYDITYVGRVKNDKKRYEDIISIFKQCRNAGLKCDFHIVDASSKMQLFADEIEYNKFMSFREIMRHVVQSKTVLEILQTGEYSPTTRYTEACLYNRNIITNCKGIKDGTYPCGENVYLLDDTLKVDTNWIKKVHCIDTNHFKTLFSINSVIDTLDSIIDGV